MSAHLFFVRSLLLIALVCGLLAPLAAQAGEESQLTWVEAGIAPSTRPPAGPYIHVRAQELPQERLRQYVVAGRPTPPDWTYTRPAEEACALTPDEAVWKRQLFMLPEFFIEVPTVVVIPSVAGEFAGIRPSHEYWAVGTYREQDDGSFTLQESSCAPDLYVTLFGPEGIYQPKLEMPDLAPWRRTDGSMAFTAALPQDFPPPLPEEPVTEPEPVPIPQEPYKVRVGSFVVLDWTPPVLGDRSELRYRRGDLQFGLRFFGVDSLEVSVLARIGLHYEEGYGEPLNEFSGGFTFGGTVTSDLPVALRLHMGLLVGRGPVRLRCSYGVWGSGTVVCPPLDQELQQEGINYAPFDSMVQTAVISPLFQLGASFGGKRVRLMLGLQMELPNYRLDTVPYNLDTEIEGVTMPMILKVEGKWVTQLRLGPHFGIQF